MDIEEIKEILNKKYGWKSPIIKQLVGYETVNYRIQTKEQTYVLKVYPIEIETLEIIKGESEYQKQLTHLDCKYPLPISTLSGEEQFIWKGIYIVRCLSFLKGLQYQVFW